MTSENQNNTPDETEEMFEGKTGESKPIIVAHEYPYALVVGDYEFADDDLFILEADDGSYSESMKYSDAEVLPGSAILWFPMPPESPKYSMKVRMGVSADGASDENNTMEVYLFEDEILTLRNDEAETPQVDPTLR